MIPQLPFDRPGPLAAPPELERLCAQGPVHRVRTRVGHDAWLVTGHGEVRALLDDDRLGRAHRDPDRAARSGESALFGGPMGDFDTEKADHTRMRSLLRPHFTPKRMRLLAPRVERLTAELIGTMEHGPRPADLHEALAVPLPIQVICELLGVPYADRERFRAWSLVAGDVTDRARSEQGLGELFDYGLTLVAAKRREPADDVISHLAADPDVEDTEAAGLAMALLFAGHETTVVQIGLGVLGLLADREQYRALVADPGLVPGAVEEVLRAPRKGGDGVPRYARVDFEIAGAAIAAGDLVLCDLGSANHDPGAFTDPERLDVTRSAGAHLGFGHGMRYCIGAPLARIELRAVLEGLMRRLPELRLAVAADELSTRRDVLTGGLTALPVTW
ncbi:cytochrome P450 [Nocardiopsis sp. NRRL B-16309]|uniref:cytochrome P450 n=1 Tax=Nocardiopsis sp. NRRL B-16309 TaxID=1519494 RepID=UPI0006ADAC26|nr:cytochrome P450 [Nocardiopsis sp. NRRL B-16309]KOX15546.1 cytochrome P450 [Nocardiopsis sp. NRRL B-16309]